MSNNFKKFFISLFNSNKRSSKYNNRLNKLIDEYNNEIQQNINNSENNSNKDMLEIVIPGHYCSNDTLDSKVKNIIRIVGPDRNRQGYWITQDGKSLNENLILDGYTLLDTAAGNGKSFEKGNGIVRKKHKDIMKGFKPIKPKNQQDDEDKYIEQPYERKIPEHLKPEIQQEPTKIQQEPKPVKKDPLAETKKLLEKATIEQLNINYEKKYGTQPYKSEVITVPLKIEIPYHLEKLNQICEIFELDTNTVAQIIFENLRLPEEIILQILNDKLSGRVPDICLYYTSQSQRD
ncbi:MAG: hypothetical protein K2L64_00765 [Ureaplasma sp.]|nr:hypothetical protein [Ureaplasma sp.]